jgi:hypothetical protein
MKKRTKMMMVLFVLAGMFIQTAAAEDAGVNAFAQNLIQSLERMNWEVSEVGELERHLYTYEWKNLQGVDPLIMAQVLSYSKERGIHAPDELAEMAYQLSLSAREMMRLGFESREIMRAATDVVRTIATERVTSRTGEQTPDLAGAFREQLRRQIDGSGESSLQRRAQQRVSRPERADTWTPPTPEERPGGGRQNVPSGPGESSGSATEPPSGNGGR